MPDAIGDAGLLRWISDNTGRVSEPQMITLKRVAMLVGGGPVTLSFNTEAKSISYSIRARKQEGVGDKLGVATRTVLGRSWVSSTVFEKSDVKPSRKSAKNPKRKRTGRVSKVRGKR